MSEKMCILYNRICTDCGECNRCDLDPNKICDNCFKCLETTEDDYIKIPLRGVYQDEQDVPDEDELDHRPMTIAGFKGRRVHKH